jgi:hypothetical protein
VTRRKLEKFPEKPDKTEEIALSMAKLHAKIFL